MKSCKTNMRDMVYRSMLSENFFKGFIVAAILFFITPSDIAHSQDPYEIDKVVVTSTMTERLITESPGTIEVITEREIKDMNATTVADALEEATGLTVVSAPGRVRTPSIRGARMTHTLVLIDGRRLAVGFRDVVDINQIPLTMVQRIEVLRGPGSALYGSDALGGVVNIITKKAPKKWTVGGDSQYGIDNNNEGGKFIGSVYGGSPIGERFSFLLSGQLREKKGWGDDRLETSEAVGGDEEKLKTSAGRFSFQLAPGHDLSAGFEYSEMDRKGLRLMQNAVRDRKALDERLSYYLAYDATIASTDRAVLRVNRSEYKNTTIISPPADESDSNSRKNTLNQVEGRYTGLFFDAHVMTIGTEYREEKSTGENGRDYKVDNLSAYVQDEYQILGPLFIVGSVRMDRHSEFGSRLTPRLAMICGINENWRIKASYGVGFRAPSISEIFEETTRRRGREIYEPNPDLDPEKSKSYEVGIEGNFRNLNTHMTVFRNEVDDMIDVAFDRTEGTGSSKIDYYQWHNVSRARMQGVELNSRLLLPMGFSFEGNLTWLDTKDKDTGKELTGHPEYKSRLKLAYANPDWKLNANIRMNYTGRRYYETGDQGGYTTLNLYLSKGLGDNYNLFFGCDNIFDNHTNDLPPFYYAGLRLDF